MGFRFTTRGGPFHPLRGISWLLIPVSFILTIVRLITGPPSGMAGRSGNQEDMLWKRQQRVPSAPGPKGFWARLPEGS